MNTIPKSLDDDTAVVLSLYQGYSESRVIRREDGTRELWALSRMVFTYGVACIDLETGCIEHRYCYATYEEAQTALADYHDLSQHPPGNWIKHKGHHNEKWVDDLNPDWVENDI